METSMTFEDARARLIEQVRALGQVAPGDELASTAMGGQFFDQAVNMDFSRVDDLTYVATSESGTDMWLYVKQDRRGPAFGQICCGNRG
jgi:hypothetical protein